MVIACCWRMKPPKGATLAAKTVPLKVTA